MSKKILILGRDHHPDGKETADDIYKGLLKTGKFQTDELELVHYKNLLFDISIDSIKVTDTESGLDLADVKSALMTNWFSHASVRKDIAYSLALFWNSHKTHFFNTEALHNRSTSKLSQMVLAALNSINIPRTLFSLNFEKLIEASEKELAHPYILKDAKASRGKSNYLIRDRQEVLKLKSQHTEVHPFMAQQFIDAGRTDYRVFVVDGKTRLIIKRVANSGSHITNTSSGATAELLPAEVLGSEVDNIVSKCAQLLHREVTGIDIIIDKSTDLPYFLEANPIPQIATGTYVEQKLKALAETLSGTAGSDVKET